MTRARPGTDSGKSILDEHRNHPGYATLDGPEDRGKHQSEMVQLDKNRILISLGQHKNHRRLVIVDRRWVAAKNAFHADGQGPGRPVDHPYLYPPAKKAIAAITANPPLNWCPTPLEVVKKVLQIKRLNDPELVNEKSNVDYQDGAPPGTSRTGPRGWSSSASVWRTGTRRTIPAFRFP